MNMYRRDFRAQTYCAISLVFMALSSRLPLFSASGEFSQHLETVRCKSGEAITAVSANDAGKLTASCERVENCSLICYNSTSCQRAGKFKAHRYHYVSGWFETEENIMVLRCCITNELRLRNCRTQNIPLNSGLHSLSIPQMTNKTISDVRISRKENVGDRISEIQVNVCEYEKSGLNRSCSDSQDDKLLDADSSGSQNPANHEQQLISQSLSPALSSGASPVPISSTGAEGLVGLVGLVALVSLTSIRSVPDSGSSTLATSSTPAQFATSQQPTTGVTFLSTTSAAFTATSAATTAATSERSTSLTSSTLTATPQTTSAASTTLATTALATTITTLATATAITTLATTALIRTTALLATTPLSTTPTTLLSTTTSVPTTTTTATTSASTTALTTPSTSSTTTSTTASTTSTTTTTMTTTTTTAYVCNVVDNGGVGTYPDGQQCIIVTNGCRCGVETCCCDTSSPWPGGVCPGCTAAMIAGQTNTGFCTCLDFGWTCRVSADCCSLSCVGGICV